MSDVWHLLKNFLGLMQQLKYISSMKLLCQVVKETKRTHYCQMSIGDLRASYFWLHEKHFFPLGLAV